MSSNPAHNIRFNNFDVLAVELGADFRIMQNSLLLFMTQPNSNHTLRNRVSQTFIFTGKTLRTHHHRRSRYHGSRRRRRNALRSTPKREEAATSLSRWPRTSRAPRTFHLHLRRCRRCRFRAFLLREERYQPDPIPLRWDGPSLAFPCSQTSAWSLEKVNKSKLRWFWFYSVKFVVLNRVFTYNDLFCCYDLYSLFLWLISLSFWIVFSNVKECW